MADEPASEDYRTPSAMEPISIRIPEAVRVAGMSRSRIYELIKAGKIETVKVGASTLVLDASLKALLEERRSGR